MGLAASQARLLTLQSRMNDLELKMQLYSSEQILLTIQQGKTTTKYNEALEKANEIGPDYIVTKNTTTRSGSETTPTSVTSLRMKSGNSTVSFNYNTLKSMGYEIAPKGSTPTTKQVSQQSAAQASPIATQSSTPTVAKAPVKAPESMSNWTSSVNSGAIGSSNASTSSNLTSSGFVARDVNGLTSGSSTTTTTTPTFNRGTLGSVDTIPNTSKGTTFTPAGSTTGSANSGLTFTPAGSTASGSFIGVVGRDTATGSKVTADTTPSNATPTYEYATNDVIKNAKADANALIEGLMNGSIGIFKDGKEVSLSEVGIEKYKDESEVEKVWDETTVTSIETIDYSERDKARQKAKTEYDAEIQKVTEKTKVLEIQSKQAQTEYQAASTEYESMKSLVKEVSDRSFNIWS